MLTYVSDIYVIVIYINGLSLSDIYYNSDSDKEVSVNTSVAGC